MSRTHATDRAETPPHKIPVHLAREPHQRMAWIDELLQGRLKQIVLTIVARLAHGFPQQRISPLRESWGVKIGNPKTQESLHPHPAFLQNRILVQAKSARSIKRFRILHGRLSREGQGYQGLLLPLSTDESLCTSTPALPLCAGLHRLSPTGTDALQRLRSCCHA